MTENKPEFSRLRKTRLAGSLRWRTGEHAKDESENWEFVQLEGVGKTLSPALALLSQNREEKRRDRALSSLLCKYLSHRQTHTHTPHHKTSRWRDKRNPKAAVC